MPIKYYNDPNHRTVSVKPWAIPTLRKIAAEDKVPQVKVVTDAVEAYSRLRQGKTFLPPD